MCGCEPIVKIGMSTVYVKIVVGLIVVMKYCIVDQCYISTSAKFKQSHINIHTYTTYFLRLALIVVIASSLLLYSPLLLPSSLFCGASPSLVPS